MQIVRRIVGGQVLVSVIGGLGVSAGWGADAAVAFMFGGVAALANAGLLVWRMRSDWRRQGPDPRSQLGLFFRSSFERFAAVIVLFVMGRVVLGLQPLPVLAGFVAGQLVLLATSISIHERE